MADLEPLIRYRKHQLDEKRKNLARLYDELEKILANKAKLLKDLETEKGIVSENPEDIYALQSLNNFYVATKSKVSKENSKITKMEARIDIAREDMRLTFGDLKKIEITQEMRLEQEAKELSAKESALFDEIGLEMHRRNKS